MSEEDRYSTFRDPPVQEDRYAAFRGESSVTDYSAFEDTSQPFEMRSKEGDGFWAGFGSLIMQGGAQLDKASDWLLEATGFDGEPDSHHAKAEEDINTYDPEAAVRSKSLDYILNKFDNSLGISALNKAVKFGVQATAQGAGEDDPFVKAGRRADKYLGFIDSVGGREGVAGTTTHASVRDQVLSLSHEELTARSQRYRDLYSATEGEAGGDQKLAKQYLADQIASKAGWEAGLATEVLGTAATTEWEKLLGPSGKAKKAKREFDFGDGERGEGTIAEVAGWVGDRFAAFVGAQASGIGGTLQFMGEIPDSVAPFLGPLSGVKGFADKLGEVGATDYLLESGKALQEEAKKHAPDDPFMKWFTDLTDGALNMVPAVVAGGSAGLAVMGLQVYGRTYDAARTENKDAIDSTYMALRQTLWEIGPEKAFGFFDKLGGAGVRDWVMQSLREGGSEIVTYILEKGDEMWLQGKPWVGWGEFIKQGLYEGSIGYGMGAVLSVGMLNRKKDDTAADGGDGGGFRSEEDKGSQSRVVEQADKTRAVLIETHGLTEEEADELLDPIAETFATDDNFVDAFTDLRYLEDNGTARPKDSGGDDLDLDQESEFYMDEEGNKHPLKDMPKDEGDDGKPPPAGAAAIDELAHEAASSPENELPEPTEGQIDAGNYKKGHINLHGMRISIENPKGSVRKHASGETELQEHYGYIRDSMGRDGDQIDVFVGADAQNADNSVFVISQNNRDGSFDEHKVMLGYASKKAAEEAYYRNYDNDYDRVGSIEEMSVDSFKAWADEETKRNLKKAAGKAAKSALKEALKGDDDKKPINAAPKQPDEEEKLAGGTVKRPRYSLTRADYQGEGAHTAPGRNDYNAPLHDLTKLYPADVYGPNAAQYYGHLGGRDLLDVAAAKVAQKFRGKPGAKVTVYRAVPAGQDAVINAGDWVTPVRAYAEQHGERFDRGAEIISVEAKASELHTDANSMLEYGYNPEVVTKSGPARLEQAKKAARVTRLEQTKPETKSKPKTGKTLFSLRAAPKGATEAPLKKATLKNGNPSVDANVVHFSNTPDLPKVLGSFYGTGVSEKLGAEKASIDKQSDQRIKKRVYFNVRQGAKVAVGEMMVRGASEHVYTGKINNLYDIKTDHLGLIARGKRREIGMNQIEGMLLDRGYNGLVDSEDGRGVVLNSDVELAYQGTQGALQGELLAEPEVKGFLSTAEAGYGKQSDLYESIKALSPKAKRAFHDDQAAVILHKDMRMDLLAEKLGVDRSLMTFGIGAYEGGLNPVMLVELDSAETADAYALAVKYIYQQDAVPWMRAIKETSEATRHIMTGVLLTKKDGWSKEDMQHLTANGMDGFTKADSQTIVFANLTEMDQDKFEALTDSATGALEGVTIEQSYFEGEYHAQKGSEETAEALEISLREQGSPDLLQWIRGRKAAAQQRAERFFENLTEEGGNGPTREAYQNLVRAREKTKTHKELEKMFTNRSDEWWGIGYDEDGVSNFEDSPYNGVQCTGFACAVGRKLRKGRVVVNGYSQSDNPTAGTNKLADGHDFAVVDGRYIVDPWLTAVESGRITTHAGETIALGGRVVFDMETESALVGAIYGDKSAWETLTMPAVSTSGWSPERRKAQSERMKKLHAERRATTEQVRKLFERRGADVDFDVDASVAGAYTEGERQEAMVDYIMEGVGSKYFKRWFGKSQAVDGHGTPIRFYHSTYKEFTEFKGKRIEASFFTPDPGFASRWGQIEGQRVMPVYIKAEKLFDFENKKVMRSLRRHLKAESKRLSIVNLDRTLLGKPASVDIDILAKRVSKGSWSAIESKHIQGFLRARGYDAFWAVEAGVKNIGVFNPSNIKSATGNAGTFDSSTNDIRYSLGEKDAPASTEDGSEFNRRLELYQMINYLTEQSKPGDKPAVLRLRILDGLRRGFYSADIVQSSGVMDNIGNRTAMLTHAREQIRGEKITKMFSLSKRVIDNDLRDLRESLPDDIPDHFVHEDYRSAPAHLVRDIESHGYENQVEALVDPMTGTIHVFAQNIGSRQKLHRAFIEELMGHHGLSRVFGEELNGLLTDILPSVEGSAAWKELIKTYTDIAKDLESDNPATVQAAKLRATEELIAKQDVEQKVWDRIVAWIRAWMRTHGKIHDYTEGDIRRLMSVVHNSIMSGRQPHPWGVRNHPPRMRRPLPQYANAGTRYSVLAFPDRTAQIGNWQTVFDYMSSTNNKEMFFDLAPNEVRYDLLDGIDARRVFPNAKSLEARLRELGEPDQTNRGDTDEFRANPGVYKFLLNEVANYPKAVETLLRYVTASSDLHANILQQQVAPQNVLKEELAAAFNGWDAASQEVWDRAYARLNTEGSKTRFALRPKFKERGIVSPRFAAGATATEDPIADLLVSDLEGFIATGPTFAKNMLKIKRDYNNLTEEQAALSNEEAAEAFVQHVSETLVYVWNNVPKEVREISRGWYKGANKLAKRFARKHKISPQQAAAVIANLSPQQNWYINLSLAERVMDIYHERANEQWSAEMTVTAKRIFGKKGIDETLASLDGKTLSEVSGDIEQAIWIRTYDETNNSSDHRVVAPDGRFLGYVQTPKSGKNRAISWGSTPEIAKAISVLRDGNYENISRSLGTANKVRNFYNNIVHPDSTREYVTSDTQAVAAGLMKPLSSNSVEAQHNFGQAVGSSSSKPTGYRGSYALYEAAYRRAAAAIKDDTILPREMQSVTWEAVRELFPPAWKAKKLNKTNVNVVKVERLWDNYRAGKATQTETLDAIVSATKEGFRNPVWYVPDVGLLESEGDTSYQRKLPEAVVPRPEAADQTVGGRGVDAARDAAKTGVKFSLRDPEDFQLTPPAPNLNFAWSTDPFYSALTRVVERADGMPKKGAPKAFIQWLDGQQKKGRLKKEERDWLGLDQWLESQKEVTRTELQKFVKQNQTVLKEVLKAYPHEIEVTDSGWVPDGTDGTIERNTFTAEDGQGHSIEYIAENNFAEEVVSVWRKDGGGPLNEGDTIGFDPGNFSRLSKELIREDFMNEFNIGANEGGEPQYAGEPNVLPGGKNHKEMLIILPPEVSDEDVRDLRNDATRARKELDAAIQKAFVALPEVYGVDSEVAGRAHANNMIRGLEAINVPAHEATAVRELLGKERADELVARFREANEKHNEMLARIRDDSFSSGHYQERGIMAWVRFNERTVNGKRMLFIEEIQSDGHQAGREEGYKTPADDSEIEAWWTDEGGANEETEFHDLTPTAQRAARRRYEGEVFYGSNRVPDAPFKKTWPMLAMKRMIRYAAENNFESVGWTSGAQQAERYNLANYISSIEYNPNTKELLAFDELGGNVIAETVERGKIKDYIGAELAADLDTQIDEFNQFREGFEVIKSEDVDADTEGLSGEQSYVILDGNGELIRGSFGVIEFENHDAVDYYLDTYSGDSERYPDLFPAIRGADLQVGGEGMKGFYDKALRNNTNKFIKSFGARAEWVELSDSINPHLVVLQTENGGWGVWDGNQESWVRRITSGYVHTGDTPPSNSLFVTEGGASRYLVSINNAEIGVFDDLGGPAIHSFDVTDSMREAAHGGFTMYSLRKHKGDDKALSIINSKITKPKSEWGLYDRIANWMSEMRDGIATGDVIWGMKQGLLDEGASLERWEREVFGGLLDAQYSPYKMLNLTRNLPSVMAAISKAGIPALIDGAFQPVKSRKGFAEILRPLYEHKDGDMLDKWMGYAAARRSKDLIQEKNKDGTFREKLFSQEEIDELLALGDKYPLFSDVFDDWQNFNNDLLNLAVDRGVLTEEQRDIWSQNDYIPFYRATEAIEMVDQRTGFGRVKAGIEGQHHGTKRLYGSEAALGNIVENMWFNTASLIDKIYKNESMERVVSMLDGIAMNKAKIPFEAVKISNRELANALGRAGLFAGDHKTDAAYDQNQKMIQEGDRTTPRGWLTAVENMTSEQKMKWSTVFRPSIPTAPNIVSVMRKGKLVYYEVEDKELLSTLKGMQAEGVVGLMKAMNMSKSILTKMITIDPGFMLANWMRDTLSAWVTSEANFTPVVGSIAAMKDIWNEEGAFTQMMMSGAGGGGFYDLTGGSVSKALKDDMGRGGWWPKAWRGYMKMGAMSENSNRIAIAQQWIKNGGSVAEGMHQAQDIMNFTMSGDYAAVRFFVRVLPFVNARIQGTYRLYRGARDHPVGFTIKGLAIAMATLALLKHNDDDDDYQRLEGWQKDRDWSFFVGGIRYTIPKPFEVGLLFGTLPERLVRGMIGRDDFKASKDSFWRGMSETLALNPVPQLFKPALELYMNHNFFTGNSIVPKYWEGTIKPERQFSAYTSQAARVVGDVLPEFTGKAQSPKRIEHAVRAYAGTVGLYVLNSVDWAIRQGAGDSLPALPARKWYEKPVLNRVIKGEARTSRYNKYTDRLYEMVDAANEINSTINAELKALRFEEAKEMLEENKELLAQKPVLNMYRKAMRDFSAQGRAIMDSPILDAEEKRARLDKLNIQRNKMLSKAAPMLDRLRLQ